MTQPRRHGICFRPLLHNSTFLPNVTIHTRHLHRSKLSLSHTPYCQYFLPATCMLSFWDKPTSRITTASYNSQSWWQGFHHTLHLRQAPSGATLSTLKSHGTPCSIRDMCNWKAVMTNCTTGPISYVCHLHSTTLTNTSSWIATAVIILLCTPTLMYEKYCNSNVLTLPHGHDTTATYGTLWPLFHVDGLILTQIEVLGHDSIGEENLSTINRPTAPIENGPRNSNYNTLVAHVSQGYLNTLRLSCKNYNISTLKYCTNYLYRYSLQTMSRITTYSTKSTVGVK